jgi:valyl-tRNA synthetase
LGKAENQKASISSEIRKLEATISAKGYERTKAEIQVEHREKLVVARASLVKVTESVALFMSLMTPDQITSFHQSKNDELKRKLAEVEAAIVKLTPTDTAAKLSKKDQKLMESLQQQQSDLEESLASLNSERTEAKAPAKVAAATTSSTSSPAVATSAPAAAPTVAAAVPTPVKVAASTPAPAKSASPTSPASPPASSPKAPAKNGKKKK